MTSSHGYAIHITDPLCRQSIGYRWIQRTGVQQCTDMTVSFLIEKKRFEQPGSEMRWIEWCHPKVLRFYHYGYVIMGTIASQITSLIIVYPTVYSGADQRKHQSSASLAFVRGISRGPGNSPHKWPVTQKMFPFDDVIMFWTFLPPACPPNCSLCTYNADAGRGECDPKGCIVGTVFDSSTTGCVGKHISTG